MFADTPSNLETSTASYRKTAAIISPTTILRGDSGYSFKTGDKVRTLGFYGDLYEAGDVYQGRNLAANNDNAELAITGYNVIGSKWETSALANAESIEIVDEDQIGMGDVLDATRWTGPSSHPSVDLYINTSPATTDTAGLVTTDYPAGVGGQKQIVDVQDTFDYYNPGSTPISGYNSIALKGKAHVITSSLNEFTSYWWREISYDRELLNQYGGNTYEARSGNEYISAGAYEKISDYSLPNRSLDVYGGDS
jgi:hypothetical protein